MKRSNIIAIIGAVVLISLLVFLIIQNDAPSLEECDQEAFDKYGMTLNESQGMRLVITCKKSIFGGVFLE